MEPVTNQKPPNRITDLVTLKEQGFEVVCNPTFEILPVDIANDRLRLLYEEFDQASIKYNKRFFD